MSMREALRDRVEEKLRALKDDLRGFYGLDQIRDIAIQRVREELEEELERVMQVRYAATTPKETEAVSRLVLFNSMCRGA
jgi:hypothetical protein